MKEIIAVHQNKYPKSTEADILKLIYQSIMGCEHIITDYETSLKRIKDEYGYNKNEEISEPIGNVFIRFHFNGLKPSEFRPEIINQLFILSSKIKAGDKKRLLSALNSFPFTESFIEDYINSGCPAVSHSDLYRSTYNPHYRVIYNGYGRLYPLLVYLEDALKNRPVTIAFDGRSASGKTFSAEAVGKFFDCNIIHTDDFFLPFNMRTKERLTEIGGNIHYERFKSEVIDCLGNDTLTYGRFDCGLGKIAEEITISKKPLTIIEGAYSLHPYLNYKYDWSVFFDIDPKEQQSRIIARNGENLAKRFENEWIPMENRYIEEFGIKEKCDYYIF